ncbi:class III lanthionine synthetase LanKC [Streptomyces uncialis]|uniref:class III lanthionine synthetase LanKC n=1 Tax=Streptomyces uncialis TaxID=1048205 RepID=UPI003863B37D|nr:class III lanthionine synthetase LanKC [Streptomyces uncialis]
MEDYVWYCQAGQDFYERPDASRAGSFLIKSPTPDDWKQSSDDSWVFFHPVDAELAEQGWKIHVSVTPADAEETIGIVARYCFARRIPFKVLASPRVHLRMNSKYAPRGGSGKLITIYPSTVADLHSALEELESALGGRQGSYILSDLRWRKGPLYVRYGGFKEIHTTDERGRRVLALRQPDGELTPDVRGPSFQTPPWVEVPEFLAEQQRMNAAESTDSLPYTVKKALHFSNGGGIYLADDPGTGKPVVLREARPFAGLDGAGTDAVSRLYREADTLRDLGDLDFVPTPLGTLICWEHHFLAQEYIEGQTLWDFIVEHNPATRSSVTPDELSDYARTASGILDQIAEAVSAVHDRGYVYGDLHPRNVIVRPDGRIALVDFEVAYRPGADAQPTIACPGFVAEHASTGTSRDTYALDCLRVAMFLPLTQLLDLDAGKARELPDAVAGLFPTFEQVDDALVERLRPLPLREEAGSGLATAFAAAGDDLDGPDMHALMDAMARGINASATPGRTDRLFPGDPRALDDGGHTLAHGAAGVLYALRATGRPVAQEHVEWLSAAALRTPVRPGLWDGLHGTALVLHGLGREQEAYEVLERATPIARGVTALGLHDGLAGIGLALRHMAATTGSAHWRRSLDEITTRLADAVSAREGDISPQADARPGLLHGPTGAALFFLRRHQDTRDEAYLDLAARALEMDLKHCRVDDKGDVSLAQGPRRMPYLGHGSGGLAEVVSLFLGHRFDARLAGLRNGMLRACAPPFTIEPGLLMGRAGLMTVLAAHTRPTAASGAPNDQGGALADQGGALADHVRRLAWHAVARDHASDAGRTVAFPGHRLLRLSMDLGSGTAGALLALDACARATRTRTSEPFEGATAWAEATGIPVAVTTSNVTSSRG